MLDRLQRCGSHARWLVTGDGYPSFEIYYYAGGYLRGWDRRWEGGSGSLASGIGDWRSQFRCTVGCPSIRAIMLAIAIRREMLLGHPEGMTEWCACHLTGFNICSRDCWRSDSTRFGLLAAILVVLALVACTPQPIETLVRCEGLPVIMCDQLTPVVIGNLVSSERSSVIEIRIVCSVEQCTPAEGAYRAWVRFAYGSERELPDGQWASG